MHSPASICCERLAAEISLPAFAIGGITRENLPQVQAAGIHRIAVTGAVVEADDPAFAARELMAMLSAECGVRNAE